MGKNKLLFTCLLACGMHASYAQTESEPNDALGQANLIAAEEEVAGDIGIAGDRYDYYKTLLPAPGTVTVYLEGTHTGGSTGPFSFYAYDKSGREVARRTTVGGNVAEGESVTDTIVITSRAVDSIYFLIYQGSNRSFNYQLRYEVLNQHPDDAEPNNGFAQAIVVNEGHNIRGQIGYVADGVTDRYDYYKTLLPEDGTVKVYLEGVHTGGSTGSFSFYAYDKSNRQIARQATVGSNVSLGGVTHDTIEIHSRAVDSIYFVVYQGSSRSFSYTMSYEVVDGHAGDEEPNSSFGDAVTIAAGQVQTGKIGYVVDGVTDRYDYYKTQLPENGTVKVKLEALHTGGNNGVLSLYVYDKSGRPIGKRQVGDGTTEPGDTVSDVLEVSSRSQANETIYFLVYQGGSRSFAYQLSYEVGDLSEADPEPNDTFAQAGGINAGESLAGLIGYVADGVTDRYDYYKTLLPASGTVTVYLEGTHTGGSTGSFSFYAYDKSGREIVRQTTVGGNVSEDESVTDTIVITSRAVDSIYFLVYQGSNRSFNYQLSYEVLDQRPDDAEPNNGFAQALVVNEGDSIRGQIGYVANGVTDRYDYYKTLLPEDGTVKVYLEGVHTGGSTGSFSFYAYDKSNRQIATQATVGSNVPPGGVIRDTIEIHSRAVDSIYFVVYQGSSRSFAYEMRYEVVDRSPNDPEVNDAFNQAADLVELETVNGHIGYVADGVTDRYDYYKTLLPEDGTVKVYLEGIHTGGSTGSFSFYAFDKSNRQIARQTTVGSNVSAGEVVRDTIELYSRAADSLYFSIYQGSSRSFSYTLRYEMVDKGVIDWEPDNTFQEATTVDVADAIEGHIGYVADGVTDRNDYYVFEVPANGNIDVYVAGLNTSGRPAGFHLYAYDTNRRGVASQRVGGSTVDHGGWVRDTVSLACVQTDSLYIRVYQGGTGSFQYEIELDHIDRQPHAAFDFERVGNEIGFRAAAGNADEYRWDFGDGTTATGRFPMKTYGFGSYTARLIAVNSVCGLTDTAEYTFDFKGVEYFTPTSVGKGGDGMIQVFGGGLSENTVITLSNGGNTLQPDGVYASSKGTSMTATFDLHFAEEGEYDVTIHIPGEDPLVYPGAFTIGSFTYPTTWSEVTGPDEWRVGRETRFNLVVGNKGNVTASGVIVGLLWPKSVDLTFEHKQIVPPADGTTTIFDDDGDSFTLPNAEIQHIYEELDTATPIDSFKNEPYNGYMRLLMIPHVPAGTTYELPFNVRATSPSAQNFITFTLKPNYFGSCETPNYADVSMNAASEMIDLVDMMADNTKNVPLQTLTKTLKVGQKHLGVSAKYAGAKFWSWWDGYDMSAETYADIWQDLDAANEYALITATEEVGKLMLSKGLQGRQDMLKARKQKTDFINKRLANNQGMSSDTWMRYQEKLLELSKLPDAASEINRLKRLEKMFDTVDKLKTLEDKRQALMDVLDDCPELAEQLKDLLDEVDRELTPRDEREKETRSVGSMDPNAIYGPSGVGTGRFVNSVDRQSFLVTFENVDTASAAAQIVRVLDTLDANVFDLSSFEFGNVTIGTDNYRVPKRRKEFVLDLDPVPGRPLRVRINAALDTLTGIIEWQFFSVDPQTGDLPVLDGFLPPNVNFPEGEGSVSYSVNLREDIGNGVVVRNRASIIFDENEPILTNIWQNTTDLLAPQSTVIAEVKADTVVHLRLSGNDGGSGLGYYHIYFSENGGEWFPFTGTSQDTLSFAGEIGGTYSFYVTSDDRVGNRESKAPVTEATVSIGDGVLEREPSAKPFILAPNPSSTGTPSIISTNYTGAVTVRVANVLGQEMVRPTRLEMHAGVGTPINLSRLGTGIYFIVIRQEDGKVYRDKLIIHKP